MAVKAAPVLGMEAALVEAEGPKKNSCLNIASIGQRMGASRVLGKWALRLGPPDCKPKPKQSRPNAPKSLQNWGALGVQGYRERDLRSKLIGSAHPRLARQHSPRSRHLGCGNRVNPRCALHREGTPLSRLFHTV